MVLVAKVELLSNNTTHLFSSFWHDSGEVNHPFFSRIDLKIIHFQGYFSFVDGDQKYLVDILEQLQ